MKKTTNTSKIPIKSTNLKIKRITMSASIHTFAAVIFLLISLSSTYPMNQDTPQDTPISNIFELFGSPLYGQNRYTETINKNPKYNTNEDTKNQPFMYDENRDSINGFGENIIDSKSKIENKTFDRIKRKTSPTLALFWPEPERRPYRRYPGPFNPFNYQRRPYWPRFFRPPCKNTENTKVISTKNDDTVPVVQLPSHALEAPEKKLPPKPKPFRIYVEDENTSENDYDYGADNYYDPLPLKSYRLQPIDQTPNKEIFRNINPQVAAQILQDHYEKGGKGKPLILQVIETPTSSPNLQTPHIQTTPSPVTQKLVSEVVPNDFKYALKEPESEEILGSNRQQYILSKHNDYGNTNAQPSPEVLRLADPASYKSVIVKETYVEPQPDVIKNGYVIRKTADGKIEKSYLLSKENNYGVNDRKVVESDKNEPKGKHYEQNTINTSQESNTPRGFKLPIRNINNDLPDLDTASFTYEQTEQAATLTKSDNNELITDDDQSILETAKQIINAEILNTEKNPVTNIQIVQETDLVPGTTNLAQVTSLPDSLTKFGQITNIPESDLALIQGLYIGLKAANALSNLHTVTKLDTPVHETTTDILSNLGKITDSITFGNAENNLVSDAVTKIESTEKDLLETITQDDLSSNIDLQPSIQDVAAILQLPNLSEEIISSNLPTEELIITETIKPLDSIYSQSESGLLDPIIEENLMNEVTDMLDKFNLETMTEDSSKLNNYEQDTLPTLGQSQDIIENITDDDYSETSCITETENKALDKVTHTVDPLYPKQEIIPEILNSVQISQNENKIFYTVQDILDTANEQNALVQEVTNFNHPYTLDDFETEGIVQMLNPVIHEVKNTLSSAIPTVVNTIDPRLDMTTLKPGTISDSISGVDLFEESNTNDPVTYRITNNDEQKYSTINRLYNSEILPRYVLQTVTNPTGASNVENIIATLQTVDLSEDNDDKPNIYKLFNTDETLYNINNVLRLSNPNIDETTEVVATLATSPRNGIGGLKDTAVLQTIDPTLDVATKSSNADLFYDISNLETTDILKQLGTTIDATNYIKSLYPNIDVTEDIHETIQPKLILEDISRLGVPLDSDPRSYIGNPKTSTNNFVNSETPMWYNTEIVTSTDDALSSILGNPNIISSMNPMSVNDRIDMTMPTIIPSSTNSNLNTKHNKLMLDSNDLLNLNSLDLSNVNLLNNMEVNVLNSPNTEKQSLESNWINNNELKNIVNLNMATTYLPTLDDTINNENLEAFKNVFEPTQIFSNIVPVTTQNQLTNADAAYNPFEVTEDTSYTKINMNSITNIPSSIGAMRSVSSENPLLKVNEYMSSIENIEEHLPTTNNFITTELPGTFDLSDNKDLPVFGNRFPDKVKEVIQEALLNTKEHAMEANYNNKQVTIIPFKKTTEKIEGVDQYDLTDKNYLQRLHSLSSTPDLKLIEPHKICPIQEAINTIENSEDHKPKSCRHIDEAAVKGNLYFISDGMKIPLSLSLNEYGNIELNLDMDKVCTDKSNFKIESRNNCDPSKCNNGLL